MTCTAFSKYVLHCAALLAILAVSSCAWVDIPDSRNVNIPSPTSPEARQKAINERPDSVMYLPLGEDVLVPEIMQDDDFPKEMVGPFELRNETVAGALQLILADYDISLAFETQEGLTRRITVANLRGDLGKVVHEICSLANLYCSYEDGTIVIKDSQTFTVTLPPIGTADDTNYMTDVAAGLAAILGTGASGSSGQPIVDATTRTIVYSATQRTADVANRYFQRLRANTAMIVFETYIWEVSLNSGNSTGIDWSKITSFGKFNTSIALNGSVGPDFTNPISIGLPTTQDITGTPNDLISFLSQFGAVKTISQPQITVLSGSKAELRVADTRNYVSQIATTLDNNQSTTSVNTDSVDTGFTLSIASSWDKATVYAGVNIELTDVKRIDDFPFNSTSGGGSTIIQLPQTAERQLQTQIRVRPGDSVLIAGLVRENDNFDSRGIGFMKPIIPDSRTAESENLELVILLRPRVIVYTAPNDKRYVDYAMKKHKLPGAGPDLTSPKDADHPAGSVVPLQEEIPSGTPAPLTSLETETPRTAHVQPVTQGQPIVPVSPVAPAQVPATSVRPGPARIAPEPAAPPASSPPPGAKAKTSSAASPVTPLAAAEKPSDKSVATIAPAAGNAAIADPSASLADIGMSSEPPGATSAVPNANQLRQGYVSHVGQGKAYAAAVTANEKAVAAIPVAIPSKISASKPATSVANVTKVSEFKTDKTLSVAVKNSAIPSDPLLPSGTVVSSEEGKISPVKSSVKPGPAVVSVVAPLSSDQIPLPPSTDDLSAADDSGDNTRHVN